MSVHHDVLALLMTLIVHCVRIVVGGLGDWRARGRWCVIGIITSSVVDRRSVSGYMPLLVMVLLVVLWEVEGSRPRLRKPVPTIRHLNGRTEGPTSEGRCFRLYGSAIFEVASGGFRSAVDEVGVCSEPRSTMSWLRKYYIPASKYHSSRGFLFIGLSDEPLYWCNR